MGKKIMESFEVQVNTELKKSLKSAEDKVEEKVTFRYNNFNKMVQAGSKVKN